MQYDPTAIDSLMEKKQQEWHEKNGYLVWGFDFVPTSPFHPKSSTALYIGTCTRLGFETVWEIVGQATKEEFNKSVFEIWGTVNTTTFKYYFKLRAMD